MQIITRFIKVIFVLALLAPAFQTALGQETNERRSLYDDAGHYVYVSYFKIPWAKVDSLIQLQNIWNAVTGKGRELGCFVDREFLIHQTGTEYNVVFKTYYKDWASINEGCGGRAFRAAVPDSAQRTAINAGNQWVFDGVEHRDVIYWEPYPNK
jgi:hypothetical protein